MAKDREKDWSTDSTKVLRPGILSVRFFFNLFLSMLVWSLKKIRILLRKKAGFQEPTNTSGDPGCGEDIKAYF